MFKFLTFLFVTGIISILPPVSNPDLVCGKWMYSEKNLIIQVYREHETFKAKIVWFLNNDANKTMDEWVDIHNPDAALRNRKILGMSVLSDIEYVPKSNSWENGKVYDAKNGHYWDASAYINKEGELKVTGYWHFKFIGRTMTFTRLIE